MGGIGGVVLDESVVLGCDDNDGNAIVCPGALNLLCKLRFSTIHMGISFGTSLSTHKVSVLKKTAMLHSCHCLMLDASSVEASIAEIQHVWGDTGRSILYLVSGNKKDIFMELSKHGWLITVPRSFVQKSGQDAESVNASEISNMLYIDELEELPSAICRFNRMATNDSIVTVGYIMKRSREEDFAKRGAFPMLPTENGLIFMPLTFDLPISSQLKEVDVVLHKATDEIISIELSDSLLISPKITFTRGMHELESHMECHGDCYVIDPLKTIYPVLDRLKIQEILHVLEDLNTKGRKTIRGPHFLKVDAFSDPNLMQRFSEAKLCLPCIVKPQVACGVADAHYMAIAFRFEDFKDMSIPLPAVVQEYVDHSSFIFKFYVLGKQVFHAVKKSIPNAAILMRSSEENGLRPLIFDSLKSLPMEKENQYFGDEANKLHIDLDLVTDAADCLRQKLELTIFGFDVVIQEGSGDHVIVDVNYLPSFKEVPDDIAIPAFWDAIRSKFENMKIQQSTTSHP